MQKKQLLSAILSMMLLIAAAGIGSVYAEDEPYVVEDGTALIYTVKKGDTLWDLSRKFFDSPWVWPDLWSKNAQINNPHLIYPGQKIKLYKRSDTQVLSTPAPVEEARAPVAQPEAAQVLETQAAPAESLGSDFTYAKIDQVGFIRKIPVNSHGVIIKSQKERRLIGDGDIIYIRQDVASTDPMAPGREYTIYRPSKKEVKYPETGTIYGTQYDLKGVAEITEIVSQNPVIAIGRVVQIFQDINADDLLIPYEPRNSKLEWQSAPDGLKGKIISSMDQKQIFGENEIVFIDKGKKDGVMNGQRYTIYYDDALDAGIVKEVDFGALVVLHTEEDTATVVITRSESNAVIGSRIKPASPLQ